MKLPGMYFRIAGPIIRLFFPMRAERLAGLDTPCVLLCRHRNMRGPVNTVLHYAYDASPWIYYPFCEKDTFFSHMYGYTMTERLHWPKWLAYPFLKFLTAVTVPLFKSFGCIPVYRGDSHIRETFRISVDTLLSGRSIMIYPDIDYTANTDSVGSIYDGFLMLERLYFKKSGRHLPFVPVHLDTKNRRMWFGEPVVFGEGSFTDELRIAKEAILSQWHDQS